MFKRVEKRRRKQEEEEALGLDGDMKEILGIQDTDSEESDSDSSSDDGPEDVADEDEQGSDRDDDEDSESDGEEKEELPVVVVSEALKDPVYVVSIQPTHWACVVCPGRSLKGKGTLETHKTSSACPKLPFEFNSRLTSIHQAHQRRFKQFKRLAKDADPQSNAHDIIAEKLAKRLVAPTGPEPGQISKREAKKVGLVPLRANSTNNCLQKARAVKMQARREKNKVKKAKKAEAAKLVGLALPTHFASNAHVQKPKAKTKTEGQTTKSSSESKRPAKKRKMKKAAPGTDG